MSALPWIVLHGAAVWRAGLAALLFGGLAVAWARPRIAARRAARAARLGLGWPVGVSETRRGARVTLAGTLQVAEVPGEAVTASAPRLLLRSGDIRVRLDGPIEILTGSEEAWPGRLPWGGEAKVHRSLAPGDRIRVSGVLTEEASDEAPSYRDAAKRWVLSGGLTAAFDGAPRVSGPSVLVRVPPLVAAGILFLAAFGGGGELAMSRARKDLTVYASGLSVGSWWAPVQQPYGRAVLVAAATPFRRREALVGLVGALDARSDPDPEALAARAALHEMLGERVEAAAIWVAHGDPERGAEMAEHEASFALAARGWYAAGRFERAADAWDRAQVDDEEALRFGLGLHLFAGRLDRAAGVARRLAASIRAHRAENEDLRRWYEERADMVTCLADALDARRGDATAWKELHAEPEAPVLPACAVLRVDLFDGPERIRAIHDLPALVEDAYEVPRAWLDLLAAEADPAYGPVTPRPFESAAEVVAIPNGEPLANAVPAVERRLAEAHPPRRALGRRMILTKDGEGRFCVPIWRPAPSPRHAAASAGVFAFLSGDTEGVSAMVARLDEDVGLSDAYGAELSAVSALPADPAPAEKVVSGLRGEFLHGLLDVVVERDAGALLRAFATTPPPDEEEAGAWALAAAGDGAGLARWLRRPRSQPGTFLRLGAPLIRTGREDLARWIRWGRRRVTGFRPTEEVVHLASLAAAAEALSPAEAPALHARAARFREAILRRETAVPLAVIERL